MTRTPSPFRDRNFTLLWSGQAASTLGSSVSGLAYPILALSLSGSTMKAGLASTGILAGELVLTLPAGIAVDRYNRRALLIAANLMGAVSYALMAGLAATDSLTLSELVVGATLSGAIGVLVRGTGGATVRDFIATKDLPTAYTYISAREDAADLCGPPLGGLLLGAATSLPFTFDAVSYALAALTNVLMDKKSSAHIRAASITARRDLLYGFQFLRSHPPISAIAAWGALVNFAVSAAFAATTLHLASTGTSPSKIGLIDAVAAAAGLVGSLVAARVLQLLPTGWLTVVTGTMIVVCFAAVSTVDGAVAIGVALGLVMFLMPAHTDGVLGFVAVLIPPREQGRVNGSIRLVSGSTMPFAPTMSALLLGSAGWSAAGWVCALITLGGVVLLAGTRSIRGLAKPTTWRVPADSTDLR